MDKAERTAMDERARQAAWDAYRRERNEPWQDRVEAAIAAYEAAKPVAGDATASKMEVVQADMLAMTERRENGLRANMDEIASMAHQMIKIVQRGALRPDPNTGWLEPAPPIAKPAPMSTSGEMVERLVWESAEEWEIEQRMFQAAGRDDVPKDVQELVAILWKQYCLAADPSRLESLEALFAEQAGELESAESHAQMMLLAVEAGDPKPELAMRVKDLISVLSDIRKARGKE